MIAGNATPSDARMMWKPSVNAIWLRAAASCEANEERADERVAHATRRLGARGPRSQSMRAASDAVEHLRPAVLEK